MGKSDTSIKLQALFSSARSLVDGGWRLSFDINPTEIPQLTQIAQLKDKILNIEIKESDE